MNDKIQIFNFGGCDLWTILKNKYFLRDYTLAPLLADRKASFNFAESCYPIQNPSIISLYTDPGLIAGRMVEEFTKLKQPSPHHYDVYNEIVKFPYFKYWKENAGPQDILVLNFSSEFYNRFDNGKEYFTFIPAFNRFEDSDSWVRSELMMNDKFHKVFDASEIHDRSREYVREFASQVHEIFGDRVILIGTHFTDRIVVNDMLHVKQLQQNMLKINYYSDPKLGANQDSLRYAQSFADLTCRYFRHKYKSDIPYIKIPQEFVFMDLAHPYGVTPFHLHSSSNALILRKLIDEIEIIKTKYNVNKEIIV